MFNQILYILFFWISFSIYAYGQLCEASRQKEAIVIPVFEQTIKKQENAKQKPKQIRKRIQIPKNYKPPVADPNQITFPETHAKKRKQRKLINKRKKHKNKGCIAANF